MDITVIIPALNEEKNILSAIHNVLTAFSDCDISGEIIIINDGSTDRTETLVRDRMYNDNRIRLITHDRPLGIGASFWDGVDSAHADVVVLIPGDDENIPQEIFRYYALLQDVDMVIPFVSNKEARSQFRNILSTIYHFVIKVTFQINLKYTNGTVLYRKSVLNALELRNKSFFFQTDILLRGMRQGRRFREVPYKIGTRKQGSSNAFTLFSFAQVIHGYLRLIKDFYFTKTINKPIQLTDNSSMPIRRDEQTTKTPGARFT